MTTLRARLNSFGGRELAAVPVACQDPLRLNQVLMNLLSNAINSSPVRGQVVVRTSMAEQGRLRIEVQDEGIGISDSDHKLLFVRFRQLRTGATRAHGCAGIGSALLKQIVEAQGG